MENSRPDAERYKPSINIERAPGIATPLMYIGTAYVFLIAAAVVFISSAKWIVHGAYGNPLVIMMVHFFTLGFLSMTHVPHVSNIKFDYFRARSYPEASHTNP